MSQQHDVIIAGAGPAGSAAAGFLAREGFSVLVLEKEEFPRFHIGESLLPAALDVQARLGVQPDSDVFVHKGGAAFVCERSNRSRTFDFAEALAGPPRSAWHVDRARYDKVLRDRAVHLGADVRHGVRVLSVNCASSEVSVRTSDGLERGRYFLDATGQDRLLGKLSRSIVPNRCFGKAAIFAHFDGVSDDTLADFGSSNDIRVMMVPDGWAWVIPLPGRRLSVGLVLKRSGIRMDDLADYIRNSPLLRRWTAGTVASAPRMIGNFSYRNANPSGVRFACIGDASCFIDPVFSSGVSLALRSAEHAVSRLIPALRREAESDAQLMAPSGQEMERGYDAFSSLVYRFYHTNFVHHFMFGAPSDGELRSEVVSVLAGDVFRTGNRFLEMLLNTRRKPWIAGRPSVDGELDMRVGRAQVA